MLIFRIVSVAVLAVSASAAVALAGPIENPAYASWAKCKPGTSVVLKSSGGPRGRTMTETLVSVEKDKCVLEAKSESDGRKPVTVKRDVDRQITDEDAVKRYQDQVAHADAQTVTTPAGTFKCKHVKMPLEGVGTMELWWSDDVPGMTVKSVQTVTAAKQTVTGELQSVTRP